MLLMIFMIITLSVSFIWAVFLVQRVVTLSRIETSSKVSFLFYVLIIVELLNVLYLLCYVEKIRPRKRSKASFVCRTCHYLINQPIAVLTSFHRFSHSMIRT